MSARPPSTPACAFPHTIHPPGRSAILAITSLVVATSPASSLLALLGETDATLQDWMRRGHPYAFNLGGGQVLQASDHEAAADMLLERNLPDIYHDRQTATIFVPETFLPTHPIAVDTLAGVESQMRRMDEDGRKRLKIDPSLPSLVSGDRLEERLYRALKSYPANLGIVIQGACLRTPNTRGRGSHTEHDFLVINPYDKYVLAIECKRSLTGKTISGPSGCVIQLQRVKERVETYLGSKLSPDWRFVGMVYYEEDLAIPHRIICPECSPFTIKGESEVHSKLTAMEGRIRAERPVSSPNLQEYKEMVKTFLFLIFAKPSSTPCRFAADVHEKIVGKAGQGSLRSILFWTMAQAALMFSTDPLYLHVCFLAPWSCGKTLCMREKARQRARDQPGDTVNFCVVTYNISKMDPLLLLSIRQSMADLPNIRVTAIHVTYYSQQLDLLERSMQASPGDWFLDEVTLPTTPLWFNDRT